MTRLYLYLLMAVSEIDATFCHKYLVNLLPKCSHSYFIWNSINIDPLFQDFIKDTEDPLTGLNNLVIQSKMNRQH